MQMMSVRGAGVWRMAAGSAAAVAYTIVVLTNLLGCLWLFLGRNETADQGWLAQTYSAWLVFFFLLFGTLFQWLSVLAIVVAQCPLPRLQTNGKRRLAGADI